MIKLFTLFLSPLLFIVTVSFGQFADQFRQAAAETRKTAQSTLCPEKKAYLLKLAEYIDCQRLQLAGQPCNATEPKGPAPDCPADGVGGGIGPSQSGSTGSSGSKSADDARSQLMQAMSDVDPQKAKNLEDAAQLAEQIGTSVGLNLEESRFGGDIVRSIGGFTTLFGKSARKKEAERKQAEGAAQKETERKQANELAAKKQAQQQQDEQKQQTVKQQQDDQQHTTVQPSAIQILDSQPNEKGVVKETDQDAIEQMKKRVLAMEKDNSAQPQPAIGGNPTTDNQFTPSSIQKPANQEVLIIRSYPNQTIPAVIAYESDQVVNYRTREGASASINKNEIVTILFPDGHHTDFRSTGEVASFIQGADQYIQKWRSEQGSAIFSNRESNTGANSDVSFRPTLSTQQYQEYRQKALDQVTVFVDYLNVITDKNAPISERNKAVNQAAKLFLPDATIEVNSKSRSSSRRYNIRSYLDNLKLLPYRSANIEWHEVNYVKELAQAADGNYYGIISGQQTFTGYAANGQVLYSDITQKNVRVKLQSYQKSENGQIKINWDVLLGNIGLSVVE